MRPDNTGVKSEGKTSMSSPCHSFHDAESQNDKAAHAPGTHNEAALTRRKIHEASETEPKTPDRASWAVNCGRVDITAASMADMQFNSCDTKGCSLIGKKILHCALQTGGPRR